MLAQQYWNEIGAKKVFEDPLYVDRLSPLLSKECQIIEYGCGYGRVMRLLKSAGYQTVVGYDFAPNMIQRGQVENPDLDLRLLDKAGVIPCADASVDAVVLSTVLCCIANEQETRSLLAEVARVLKKNGVLYVTDFLVCEHPGYREKYAAGLLQFGVRGVYVTSEKVRVRHYTVGTIMDLLSGFEIQWFEQFDFKTMNQNPARTFHCIAEKSILQDLNDQIIGP